MSAWIPLLDGIAVSAFGSVLSASFCDALNTRRKRWLFCGSVLLLSLLQGLVYSLSDAQLLRKIYPLVMHLPLMLVLFFLSGRFTWSAISVFFAYLCCQLRRWFALFLVALIGGGTLMQDALELLITLPLLLILLHFVAPAVRQQGQYPASVQVHFGTIPMIYYGFDYLSTVYTDLLVSGGPVFTEFMPFVCCTAYLVFVLYHSEQKQKRFQLEQAQQVLGIQLNQSVREITALRESQELARQYRHDLRHHLQYLSACIENGQQEQARNYIAGICREIEAQKVQCYCENEAANLVLSAFAGRAKKDGIAMNVQGTLPSFMMISDRDLCVLLSNALENALHACQTLVAEGQAPTIDVQFYERSGKLFLQVTNPCKGAVRFEDGIPVSDKPNHGIGVRSICAIVERYGGIYTFAVQKGEFILRLSV